jgi:hypothetical protein
MTVVNKIGLEAEFFLTNKKGDLLFPNSNGFGCDEFIILGEFRATPGTTRAETISNFLKEWYVLVESADKKGKLIDIEPFKTIDGDFYAKIMRKMGTKEISQARNIYGTDILKESDAQITRGKITGHNLSIGLHVHFSSTVTNSDIYKYMPNKHLYNPIKIPIYLGEGDYPTGGLDLYTKVENPTKDEQVRKVEATVSRITRPVLEKIVREFDEKILPDYAPRKKLKFRNPGFYEVKSHGGFEYRSLPMSQKILDNLYNIVDFGFSLLEDLNI